MVFEDYTSVKTNNGINDFFLIFFVKNDRFILKLKLSNLLLCYPEKLRFPILKPNKGNFFQKR